MSKIPGLFCFYILWRFGNALLYIVCQFHSNCPGTTPNITTLEFVFDSFRSFLSLIIIKHFTNKWSPEKRQLKSQPLLACFYFNRSSATFRNSCSKYSTSSNVSFFFPVLSSMYRLRFTSIIRLCTRLSCKE